MNQTEMGKLIAECRRRKNMTQSQLAERLNTTNKSVSKWETGRGLPNPSLYEPLCAALGITMDALFAGRRSDEAARKETDDCLMRMLKYKLYQCSDKSADFAAFDNALEKMAEVTTLLRQFETKEAAVEYLGKETGLATEECAAAYDFYMQLFKTE